MPTHADLGIPTSSGGRFHNLLVAATAITHEYHVLFDRTFLLFVLAPVTIDRTFLSLLLRVPIDQAHRAPFNQFETPSAYPFNYNAIRSRQQWLHDLHACHYCLSSFGMAGAPLVAVHRAGVPGNH